MAARPRRSAANKAKETISVHVAWADSSDRASPVMSSRRSNRVTRDDFDSADDSHHEVTSKRQPTRGAGRRSDGLGAAPVRQGQRDRGGKKKYVVDDSSPEEDEEEEEEEEEEEAQVDEEDDDEEMEDAEGDDDMDLDAEGEDVDMDAGQPATGSTIKISRAAPKSKSSSRAAASRVVQDDDDEEEEDDDDDNDELSDPADSDAGDQTLGMGDETLGVGDENDAEGDEDAEGEEDQGLGSNLGDSQDDDEEPDLTKMTKRQRARFEEVPGEQDFLKLSDEVQAKKVFTAEELSMRRQEMARRRRNLSDKRNEEVKMETINKLLKKQAPKVNKKAAAAAAAADASPEDESSGISPVYIRWTTNKDGSRVSIPNEMVDGPAGRMFRSGNGGFVSGKMVDEVA